MIEPSLKFTTVSLFGDMKTSRTEYVCGLNTRFEGRSCTGHSDTTPPTNLRYEYGPLRAYIQNRDLSYHFQVDLAARIYTAIHVNEHGRPRRIEPLKRSGRTLHSHTETIDTGERRELFGYTARHVITKSRQMRDEQLLSESECDGWYIDPPAAWLILHPPSKFGTRSVLFAGTGERDDYKFTEAGERETGFVLLATWTHKSSLRDDAGKFIAGNTVRREEVTELSESPLEPHFFVPPRDFKRVPQLPDGIRNPLSYRVRVLPYRLWLHWEIIKDSFWLPNRIERFCLQHNCANE